MQAEKLQQIDNVVVLPINTKNKKVPLELFKFNPNEISSIWPLVEDLIQESCNRAGNFADAVHIKDWLEKGVMDLWIAYDSKEKKVKCVCVTEIRSYPNY